MRRNLCEPCLSASVAFFARRFCALRFFVTSWQNFVRGFVRDWFLDEKIACKIARIAGSSADRIAGKMPVKNIIVPAPAEFEYYLVENK
jgi:hypothetical protein